MKVSLIATVLNEENSIEALLASVEKQTYKNFEFVVVDGGSKDKTADLVREFQAGKKWVKLFVKKGNRSIGRNEAIKRATGDIIALTDAGCVLDKNWLKRIISPFKDKKVGAVAGYYAGKSKTVFQKSIVPYVLVMPDHINENDFLPATRSMAIRKAVWKKMGGFDKKYTYNEDYVFSRKLKIEGVKMAFVKNAIVYWKPRTTLFKAFIMFYIYALGDAESASFRPKVLFIFVRYAIVLGLIALYIVTHNQNYLNIIVAFALVYIIWAVAKNYKYVKDLMAFIFLPLLQFTSDAAVLIGTSFGVLRRLIHN